ncbi:MAG: hypothetical protein HN742_21340 [Lentisphaerae bacterium]|nr:hypothetical protein [Lentisphaerota bacterium]MBT4820423.1 hypothetical protein [Lentisphaerota bacterium]MBT5613121.1 hypothetical protein [Lentisphaerota bacterium]MBT7061986.1 hypothetical protein [Lentisphaerota bacterium]MBT7844436.1 hypothetical protein [Lentisphaerota bacterium]
MRNAKLTIRSFTLVELLTCVLILAAVISLAYRVLTVAFAQVEVLQEGQQGWREARVALSLLARDLRTMSVAGRMGSGEAGNSAAGDALSSGGGVDRIRCVLGPCPEAGRGTSLVGARLVEYDVVPNPHGAGEVLRRCVRRGADGAASDRHFAGVVGIALRYRVGDGQGRNHWVKEWSSVLAGSPSAVEATVHIAQGSNERRREHLSTMVTLLR